MNIPTTAQIPSTNPPLNSPSGSPQVTIAPPSPPVPVSGASHIGPFGILLLSVLYLLCVV